MNSCDFAESERARSKRAVTRSACREVASALTILCWSCHPATLPKIRWSSRVEVVITAQIQASQAEIVTALHVPTSALATLRYHVLMHAMRAFAATSTSCRAVLRLTAPRTQRRGVAAMAAETLDKSTSDTKWKELLNAEEVPPLCICGLHMLAFRVPQAPRCAS